ncbi:MAG: V-type ATPase subunit [Actinobacteria bacterium]|nr:V-type ATPase subunit [Actinomycetota bacterium]
MIRIDYDISDDSYYLFTCAELKTREVEFLEENRIEMMLRSGGPDEFIRALRDTVYSRYIDDIERSGSFEKAILSEYKVTVNFLGDSLKPGHQAAGDLLFLEENLHNLKVVIKSIIMDMDLERLFIPILHSYDGLKNAAMTGNYKEVEPSVSGLLQFAVELMGREKNYRLMELELEKFYLGRVLNSTGTLNSRLLSDYLRHIIDILNIKNIYRNKHLAEDLSFDHFLHENGFLPKEFMSKFEGESLDFFVKEMERTDYADMIIKGTYALHSEGTFSSFEKSGDLFYLDFFDPVKYTVSNLEKIFQFFLRKKIELKYLSIIFTGVLCGIENSKIKNKVKV